MPASNLAEVNRNWLKWVSVKVWGFQKVVQNYLRFLHYYVVVWATAGGGPLAKTVFWNSSQYHHGCPGRDAVHRNPCWGNSWSFDTTSQLSSSGARCELRNHSTSPGSSKDLGPVPLFPLGHQRGSVSSWVALACPKLWAAPGGFSLGSSWQLYPSTSTVSSPVLQEVSQTASPTSSAASAANGIESNTFEELECYGLVPSKKLSLC